MHLYLHNNHNFQEENNFYANWKSLKIGIVFFHGIVILCILFMG